LSETGRSADHPPMSTATCFIFNTHSASAAPKVKED
jgi:hypothetical protein